MAFDRGNSQVLVFGNDGRLETRFGRAGGGPGEFSPLASLVLPNVTAALIGVPDAGLRRITWFSWAGDVKTIEQLPDSRGVEIHWAIDDSGSVLFSATLAVSSARTPSTILALKDSGQISVFRWSELRPRVVASIRFPSMLPDRLILAPQPMWALGTSGVLVVAFSKQLAIRVHPLDGSSEFVLRSDEVPEPVPREFAESLVGQMQRRIESSGAAGGFLPLLSSRMIATHFPAFVDLRVDDASNIWVEQPFSVSSDQPLHALRSPFELGSGAWDVYGADGRYRHSVQFPSGFRLLSIRGGQAVGSGFSEEDEVVVQVWSIPSKPWIRQ